MNLVQAFQCRNWGFKSELGYLWWWWWWVAVHEGYHPLATYAQVFPFLSYCARIMSICSANCIQSFNVKKELPVEIRDDDSWCGATSGVRLDGRLKRGDG